MSELNDVLAANKSAVIEMVAAAERSASTWSTPRGPGKWSPSQIVEHVARATEESAKVVEGAPSKFPALPFFIRPLARGFLFNRVLRTGAFPKARTNKALNPDAGSATPADARIRLEAALEKFDRACRAAEGRRVASATFGRVSLEDYARFTEIHVRHHCRQMTSGGAAR